MAGRTHLTILLIEDGESLTRMLQFALRKAGCKGETPCKDAYS